MALPRALLTLAAMLWLRDPVRGAYDAVGTVPREFSLNQSVRFMFRCRAFIASALAAGLLTITTGAFETWVPTYLIRERAMSTASTGLMTGTLTGLGGIVAPLSVGILADLLGRRDLRWYLWIPLIGAVVFMPAQVLYPEYARKRKLRFLCHRHPG